MGGIINANARRARSTARVVEAKRNALRRNPFMCILEITA